MAGIAPLGWYHIGGTLVDITFLAMVGILPLVLPTPSLFSKMAETFF